MRSLPWRRTSRGSDDFEEATSSGGVPTSYAAFISYYRLEAGSDARFLQGALAAAFRQPVFLDATDADELRAILTDGVGRSDAVVALQTKRYLQRPWCLAERHQRRDARARRSSPSSSTADGYDFAEAKKFLSDLPAELEKANPGGVAELEAQRIVARAAAHRRRGGRRAARDAANIISVPFEGHRQPGRRRRPRDRRQGGDREAAHKLSMKNLTYSATAPSAARPTDAQSSRPTDAESSGSRSRTVSLQPSFTVSRVSEDL